ncbi:unnamed protein product [Psylliodes chrysocephalus]|uniref:BRISC and BRCA1-A complex member 2 n=1 Tax=Psylliodes chrysocephalus TaxID=3402493 RepID=A0A9P0D598_9CUCU|nr:unnamed protein product [Psylliodes chrysocephala]
MCDSSNNTDNVLSNFPLCLRKNIEELCLRSTIGFLPINLEDIVLNTNNHSVDKDILSNFHFLLKVPYAGKRLKWEVIFDPENFNFAPDFDFNDEEFLSYPDVDRVSENVPSWKNWNIKNPKSLAQVLNEFLILYKNYQIEKLNLENMYSRYSNEYKTLINGKDGIEADNIQVNIEGNIITFLIVLKVDCSSLPQYIQPMHYKGSNLSEHILYNQGNDFCHLKISVSKLENAQSNYSLNLSPRLEQILGNFKVPANDFKKDTSLTDIVFTVKRSLENRLQQIANHYRTKKSYVLNITSSCFRNIIEYDVLTFSKVVFMYAIDDYNCLVTVNIGTKFPIEKPLVILTSVYCPETKSCNQVVDKYPYNPGLKPEDNIKQLLEYLHDVVQEFKAHTH